MPTASNDDRPQKQKSPGNLGGRGFQGGGRLLWVGSCSSQKQSNAGYIDSYASGEEPDAGTVYFGRITPLMTWITPLD